MAMYTERRDLFEAGGSAATISQVYWVGDAQSISLQLDASVQTVEGSNAEGRSSAIPAASWSALTTMTDPDWAMLDVASGFRWIRTRRSGSTGTSILELRNMI